MSDFERAKTLLFSGKYTCIVCQGKRVFTSENRGVKPLVRWLREEQNFQGYSAADKVIGKATAFLYALLGVRAVYAHVVSRLALNVLQKYGIFVEYGELVERIVNRQGSGICPFEGAVLDIQDATSAYTVILQKMQNLGIETK